MDIIEQIRFLHREITERFGVERLGIFGSFARGEARSESDVDVVVQFASGRKTYDNFIELKFFLEERLGRKVDLVTFQALKPQLKDKILRETVYA